MRYAYHPQSDGQTERADQLIEKVLRPSVSDSQDDSDELLVGVEIASDAMVKCSIG